MKTTKGLWGRALAFLLAMTLLCGGVYTMAVTGAGQLFFPSQANGSIIEVDGKKYGSAMLAQQFTDGAHLWGRVMNLDTASFPDENGTPRMYAWPSNKTPAGGELEALVAARVATVQAAHPEMGDTPIPVDLVTCSGSGLDPHISPAAAEYQVKRLAANTGRSEAEIRGILRACTTGRFLGLFGEPVVNVLRVNLMLDGIL